MNFRQLVPLLLLTAMPAAHSLAQPQDPQPDASGDALKIAALEALAVAAPNRAIPLANKVLDGDSSDDVKRKALFVLSQFDEPEAQDRLLEFARRGAGDLRIEAVRMIGIGGDPDALAGLYGLYESGDRELKQAVLEAYLIADDATAVYEIATQEIDDEDFANAVKILGAMDAREELRKLREKAGFSPSLIEALAISGDIETLRELARDRSNAEQQERAIEGLMIADDEDGLVELYRESTTVAEKRMVLEKLSMMDGDRVFEIIDEALDGGR